MRSGKELVASNPDFVVMMLGSNDAKKLTWDKTGEENFKKHYHEYLDNFKNLPSKPKVFAAIPPALLHCYDPTKNP
jgi:lysophospholipase L1-like esterase